MAALKPTLINPHHYVLLTKAIVFLLLNIYLFILLFNHNFSITSHISFTKYKFFCLFFLKKGLVAYWWQYYMFYILWIDFVM